MLSIFPLHDPLKLLLTTCAKISNVFKFNGVTLQVEFEGISFFHAERPCQAVTRVKININKALRVCRSKPLKHSTRSVAPY